MNLHYIIIMKIWRYLQVTDLIVVYFQISQEILPAAFSCNSIVASRFCMDCFLQTLTFSGPEKVPCSAGHKIFCFERGDLKQSISRKIYILEHLQQRKKVKIDEAESDIPLLLTKYNFKSDCI